MSEASSDLRNGAPSGAEAKGLFAVCACVRVPDSVDSTLFDPPSLLAPKRTYSASDVCRRKLADFMGFGPPVSAFPSCGPGDWTPGGVLRAVCYNPDEEPGRLQDFIDNQRQSLMSSPCYLVDPEVDGSPIREIALFITGLFFFRWPIILREGLAGRLFGATFCPLDCRLSGFGAYYLVPIVSLYRKPGRACFRRTVMLSAILVPVRDDGEPRPVGPAEFDQGLRCIPLFGGTGRAPGFRVVGRAPAWLGAGLSEESHIDRILCLLAHRFLGNIATQDEAGLKSSLHRSRTLAACLAAPWAQPSEFINWASTQVSHVSESVSSWITPSEAAYRIDPRPCRLSDTYGLEGHLGKFYIPHQNHRGLLYFMPLSREHFPRESILWALPWVTAVACGLAALRETVSSFFRETEGEQNLGVLLRITSSLEEESDEYYNLCAQSLMYKETYKAIKIRDGTEADYQELKSKVESVKSQMAAEEQRRIAVLVTILTVIAAVAALKEILSFKSPVINALACLGLVVATIIALYYQFRIKARRASPRRRRHHRLSSGILVREGEDVSSRSRQP